MFDNTTKFAVVVSFLDVGSFVAIIFAASESDFNFKISTIGKVSLGRNESKARVLLLLLEFANIALVKKKPSNAERVMIKISGSVGT